LAAGDVLGRNTLQSLMEVSAVVDPPQLAQFFVGMREQPGAIAADRV
jgi:hypothetical protein